MMKKILISLAAIPVFYGLMLLQTGDMSAKKPDNSCATIQDGGITDSAGNLVTVGYDQWGYNYQAMMFNGWYDNYSRPSVPVNDGIKLLMKWNEAWLSNKDCDEDGKLDRHFGFPSYQGSGAWLTNHMSGEYEDTSYHWDVSGDWVIAVNSGAYLHDYTFAMTSLEDGTFTGVGGYPAGADTYTFDEIVIDGQITGDSVSFTAVYYQGGNPTGYSWTATGTIDNSGNMSGTGTSGVSDWHSTSGTAQKIYNMCQWDYFVKIVAAPADAYQDEGYWYTADGVEIGPVIWNEFAIIQEVYNDPCGGYEGVLYKSDAPKGFGWYKPLPSVE